MRYNLTMQNILGRTVMAAVAGVLMTGLTGCMTPETYAAGEMAVAASGAPKIPAFLPDKTAVPRGEVLPIDGTWRISTIGKAIRIEAGRAYAVDSWLHAFVLQIQPGHVVTQALQRTGAGTFEGNDLPMMAKASLTLLPDGRLKVKHATPFPSEFFLIPVEIANPTAMQAELAGIGAGGAVLPGPGGNPADDPLATCDNIGVDPGTDEVICED